MVTSLPRAILARGFDLDGEQIHVVSRQGIFKPKMLEDMALSLTTSSGGPYDDHFGPDDTLRYAYRGTDANHYQNRWVVNAMKRHVPLIYCHAVVPGRYLVVWPVYVVGADPGTLTFTVEADERSLPGLAAGSGADHVSCSRRGSCGGVTRPEKSACASISLDFVNACSAPTGSSARCAAYATPNSWRLPTSRRTPSPTAHRSSRTGFLCVGCTMAHSTNI